MNYYRTLPEDMSFDFGGKACGISSLIQSLERFRTLLSEKPSPRQLDQFIRDNFLVYRDTAAVLFSAYHEHSFEASFKRDAKYRFPIYARPDDLGSRNPYYTRKEIDSGQALKGRGLEIAWVRDPMDILFVQIQGSGWLREAGSGETYHIRYAGDNGHPYRSVGLGLIEKGVLPKAGFDRKKMLDYMALLTDEERQEALNHNPRYIFFEVVSSTHRTRGSIHVPLTPERSIATDPRFFPKGALAFIQTVRPAFSRSGTLKGKRPLRRFVLNQDEGGAIKGAGRVDFFMGGGKEAELTAQKLWDPGELYFFAGKPSP